MMQPTPAPTSPPRSPPQHIDEDESASQGDYQPPPQNSGSAPFSVLVGLFEKLQNERKPDKRRKLLDGWFNHWRDEKGYDLFPVLRLILPQKDKDRSVYGLKDKNIAKAYIKLIPLGTKDPDAIRLLNWKRPTDREKTSGDFSSVLYDVVSKRSSVIQGSYSIDEVNEVLDSLAGNMGKQDKQWKLLQRVYNRATPDEQRWIVRIILKDMNISAKETTVFSVFHPDAQDLYNTCSDLRKVAWTLWDPSRRLKEEDKAVQLFRAFAPMLCKRPTKTIEDSVKEMQSKTFIIEEKLDGERMQIHKRGNEYFYCSRKGKDYTYLYGKHVGTGSLTPYMDSAFDPRVEEIILDGEMLVWDPITERNLPFGTLKTAALDKSKIEQNPRPCFKVFDLLYLNGQSLLQKSCKFRKRNLRSCLREITGRIEFATEYQGSTAKDVRQRMEDVMNARGEGLVLKHPGAEYVLNGRNKDWIKVKPEYMDNMGETVDVLVVAGNYGTRKRAGGVSTLICAVVDDRHPENDDDETRYSSFVRIGSGLSFADYVLIRSKPWKQWDPKHPPTFYQTSSKGSDDKGDIYLEPEDSFILKVKAAEICPSEQYHAGFTMRFPRAVDIREDLTIADCMTLSAVTECVRSVHKRKLSGDVVEQAKKKRRTKVKKASMMPEFSGISLNDVIVESDIFAGMKFLISPDPKSRTQVEDKERLMKLTKAHGGTLVQIARNQSSMYVIYGGSTTPPDIKRIVEKTDFDIIKPQWILDCVAGGELVPLKKKYFFHATAQRQEEDDYNLDDEGEDEASQSMISESMQVDNADDTKSAFSGLEKAASPEVDPAHAHWLIVGDKAENSGHAAQTDSDTETDQDSDNADVIDIEEDVDDEWFKIPSDKARPISPRQTEDVAPGGSSSPRQYHRADTGRAATVTESKMGEDEDAMEYDQDLIFKHLCFYLDSPENARKYGMTVKPKYEADLIKDFSKLSTLITENGGHVVDLDEPKLTHVIIDKRDDSRRSELMQRTSKPKRRNLVISDFIRACLDEETLLDEDEFKP